MENADLFTCTGTDGVHVYRFTPPSKPDLLYDFPSDSLKCVSTSAGGIGILEADKLTIFDFKLKALRDLATSAPTRVALSPCGRVVFTFQAYQSIPGELQGNPNVHAYSVAQGRLLKSYIHRQTEGWLPQWTSDSSFCAVHVNGEIHLYMDNKFDENPMGRLAVQGMRNFSLCPTSNEPYIALYIPGRNGLHSSVRIYAWRNNTFVPVANKSFYRADSVVAIWNEAGTDLLILSSIKSSSQNYYGDQFLYYMTVKESGSSAIVTLPRKGTIYEVAWRPTKYRITGSNSGKKSPEELFAVCHGTLPSSVTVFGLDCEPRFHFGTGFWNQIMFNPHGNLLLMAGLGNLPGAMTVWDFESRECLSTFKTPDITSVAWFNDGEHLLLATTAPRLRVDNGFSIRHYGGQELFYQRTKPRAIPRPATADLPAATEHELHEAKIVPQAAVYPIPKPTKFQPSTSEKNVAEVYIPPALRNRSAIATQATRAMNIGNELSEALQPPGVHTHFDDDPAAPVQNQKKSKKNRKKKNANPISDDGPPEPQQSVAIPIEDKKQISQIRKKLNQIEKLKADQAAGVKLAFNQVEKIDRETELRDELARLTLSH